MVVVDLDLDGRVLPDFDVVAVVELQGGVGREIGVVDDGSVGGVEVAEQPFARVGVDGEVIGGDAGVFDGEVVAPDEAADSELGSGWVL